MAPPPMPTLTLLEQIEIVKADLLAKFARGDYHGVRDAAVDLELLHHELGLRQHYNIL